MSANAYILRADSGNAKDRMAAAWKHACEFLQEGLPVRVTVEQFHPTRSLEQNAKFHAICGDLSRQVKWCGKLRDPDDWKRLLVDAWARSENRQQCEVVPSLDGKGVVNLGIQTRRMRVIDMSDLIEFAICYCVDNEVKCAA